MVRAATHEKVSAAMLLLCASMDNAATHRARHYDLTPLITDVANGNVLHMLSSRVRIAVRCQFEPLEQSCTINEPKS